MYATFKPSGLYAIDLNDPDDVTEDFYDFRDSSGKEVQQVEFIRAVSAKYYDRGNERTDITAKITKEFPTLEDGTDWLRAMRAAVSCVGCSPPNGLLTLYARNHDGSTKQFTAADAVVTVTLAEQTGVSFVFEYHFQGGRLTAA